MWVTFAMVIGATDNPVTTHVIVTVNVTAVLVTELFR